MGAGAIGRGYLPWVLDSSNHDFVFVDENSAIVDQMNTRGAYSTYRVKGDQYEHMQVPVLAAYTPQNFSVTDHADAVACFFSVGPRNVSGAAQMMAGSQIPLILCENDPESVAVAQQVVGHSAVYFAVPDVITSNSAPSHLLELDSLSITTENGALYVEAGAQKIYGDIHFVSREELLHRQWTPKLFLHNTSHCIAAYLGALIGVTYVHEAMQNQRASQIVEGAMLEMLQALKMQWDIPHEFLDWYAEKELKRFRCRLLFDPIARVAREPLRKLELHGRLIGAAQICLSLGVLPQNILKGIVGAILFEDVSDTDHHIGLMREAMEISEFNRYILGLRPGEPLDLMLCEQIDAITEELKKITKDCE
jgi:mannitol-1-phosphate 5-dehydrogenase